jgi:hypothetical protein
LLSRVQLSDPTQAETAAVITANVLKTANGNSASIASSNTSMPYPRTEQQQADYERQWLEFAAATKLLTLKGVLPLQRPPLLRRSFVG